MAALLCRDISMNIIHDSVEAALEAEEIRLATYLLAQADDWVAEPESEAEISQMNNDTPVDLIKLLEELDIVSATKEKEKVKGNLSKKID